MQMQPEITQRDRHWRVDTRDGTWFVPGDVAPPHPILAPDQSVTESDGAIFSLLHDLVRDFVGGRDIQDISVVVGYCGRMQMPGYLDATDWSFSTTLRGIKEQLKEYA